MNTVWNSYGQLLQLPEKTSKKMQIFCRGLDIRVAQVVESDPAQTVLFQQLWKACRHGIRLDQISHCIHKYIAKVLLIIAVAADFLVVFLLLFDGF